MAEKQRSQIPMMPKGVEHPRGVEHAETEKQRLERLNRNIARRRALVAVETAIKGGFDEQPMIVGYLGLAKDSDIALALKVNLIEQVGNKLVLVSEIKEEMWREVEPGEAPATQEKREERIKLIAPSFPGLKCRNSDQDNPEYWFFTGNEAEIKLAATYLNEVGVTVWPHENGISGNYKLMVPTWISGTITTYYEELEDNEEESYVYSIAAAA